MTCPIRPSKALASPAKVPCHWRAVACGKRQPASATADDMRRALDKIGYALKPLDIVLVNTTAGKAYGQPQSATKVAQDATLGLVFQTVFGPIIFGGSIGDSQHRKFFFEAGRLF